MNEEETQNQKGRAHGNSTAPAQQGEKAADARANRGNGKNDGSPGRERRRQEKKTEPSEETRKAAVAKLKQRAAVIQIAIAAVK